MARPIRNVPTGVAPSCKCGCGELTLWSRRKNRWNRYVIGHYRQDAPYKHRDWLIQEYVTKRRTLRDIATEFGVNLTTIAKFMRKHGVHTRSASDAHVGRQVGSSNPAWKGGVTPERQRLYKTPEWKQIISAAFERDGYRCALCGSGKTRQAALHAHHLKPWSEAPELRMELTNLVTLCESCHLWVHSRRNVSGALLL